jgi:hypothetical protein
MRQTEDQKKSVSVLSNGIILLLIVVAIVPFIVLAGFGIFAIFKFDQVLNFVLLLAASALIVTLVWLRMKKNGIGEQGEYFHADSLVDASTDWGTHDLQVWETLNKHIQMRLSENGDWVKLQDYPLEIVALTAEQFHRDELAFSIPESLKMVEEVSRRYRRLLKTHVPFIEDIQISYLKLGFDHKEKVELGFQTASWALNTYRVLRMVNPVTAIISEIRNKLIGNMFSSVSDELQYKLKQALLQDVLSVAIDLYSGRFKIDDSEIESSTAAQADVSRMGAPLDPLRA